MEKRGQVAMFIIIAILIVAAVVILILFTTDVNLFQSSGSSKGDNPNILLKKCLEEDVMNTINTLSYQGGNLHPELAIEFKFGDEPYRNISYLCYNKDYYTPCISQQPMLIQHLKDEISTDISDKVEDCFNDMLSQLEDNYDVEGTYNGFEVEFLPEYVSLKIDGNVNYERAGNKYSENSFDVKFATRFYELVQVAQEISSQQATRCNFDRVGYMLYYPDFEIDLFKLDETNIYTIKHTKTDEIFRLATRSCAQPPGVF